MDIKIDINKLKTDEKANINVNIHPDSKAAYTRLSKKLNITLTKLIENIGYQIEKQYFNTKKGKHE